MIFFRKVFHNRKFWRIVECFIAIVTCKNESCFDGAVCWSRRDDRIWNTWHFCWDISDNRAVQVLSNSNANWLLWGTDILNIDSVGGKEEPQFSIHLRELAWYYHFFLQEPVLYFDSTRSCPQYCSWGNSPEKQVCRPCRLIWSL